MILSTLSLLLTGLVLLIIISALVAPFESLGWWAGWFGEKNPVPEPGRLPSGAADTGGPEHSSALVYLSGIGAINAASIPQEEIDWGRFAIRRLPGVLTVPDVYPYSVTNAGLTADRAFARLYRWLERRRLKNPYDALQFLINLRNMFQVAVSADSRYGPIYNLGVANEIVSALRARGYQVGSGKPVTLLGYSGGGQVSLGAATFLKPMLRAPIRIISIGGVMSDDMGIKRVEKLYHLWGHLDPLQGLGHKLFAGRWKMFPNSDWNTALAAGKIEFVDMGQVAHNGSQNYFSWIRFAPDGRSHALQTIDTIGEIMARDGLLDPEALRAAQAATAGEVRAYEQQRVAEAAAAKQAKREKKIEAA